MGANNKWSWSWRGWQGAERGASETPGFLHTLSPASATRDSETTIRDCTVQMWLDDWPLWMGA